MKRFFLRRSATGVAFLVLTHWTNLALAKECDGRGSQADLNLCAGDNFKQADTKLNAVYAKLLKKISAAGQAKLREAQKSWIAYRDSQCAFETLGTIDGSIHGMVVAQCLADLTEQQTKRLQQQLTCEEGDLSCGGQ